MMSQVLQCTQFAKLICKLAGRCPPSAPAGEIRLVDFGRTKILARITEFDRAAIGTNRRVGDVQVRGLVLVVQRAAIEDVG